MQFLLLLFHYSNAFSTHSFKAAKNKSDFKNWEESNALTLSLFTTFFKKQVGQARSHKNWLPDAMDKLVRARRLGLTAAEVMPVVGTCQTNLLAAEHISHPLRKEEAVPAGSITVKWLISYRTRRQTHPVCTASSIAVFPESMCTVCSTAYLSLKLQIFSTTPISITQLQ